MLTPASIGQICLLVTGRDDRSDWIAGVIRAVEPVFNTSSNSDDKKTLSAAGRTAIQWIWRNTRLPENVLLHIDPMILHAIMVDLAGPRHRQKRLDELFRSVPNRIIGRGVVATVVQEDDYIKNMRAIRRSRQNLKAEGIVVFGNSLGHRKVALHLGLQPLSDGDSVSARLIQIDGPSDAAVQLGGAWYRLCGDGEEPTKPAPALMTKIIP